MKLTSKIFVLFKRLSQKYDPNTYWSNRPNPNNDGGRETLKKHTSFIEKHTIDATKILEFGAGVGRTLMSYTQHSEISILDITERYKVELFSKASDLKLGINFR